MGWGLKGRGTQFKNCKKCDYVLNKKACILKACNIYIAAGSGSAQQQTSCLHIFGFGGKCRKKGNPEGETIARLKLRYFLKNA